MIFYQVMELRESLDPKEALGESQDRCSNLKLQLGPFFQWRIYLGKEMYHEAKHWKENSSNRIAIVKRTTGRNVCFQFCLDRISCLQRISWLILIISFNFPSSIPPRAQYSSNGTITAFWMRSWQTYKKREPCGHLMVEKKGERVNKCGFRGKSCDQILILGRGWIRPFKLSVGKCKYGKERFVYCNQGADWSQH